MLFGTLSSIIKHVSNKLFNIRAVLLRIIFFFLWSKTIQPHITYLLLYNSIIDSTHINNMTYMCNLPCLIYFIVSKSNLGKHSKIEHVVFSFASMMTSNWSDLLYNFSNTNATFFLHARKISRVKNFFHKSIYIIQYWKNDRASNI